MFGLLFMKSVAKLEVSGDDAQSDLLSLLSLTVKI